MLHAFVRHFLDDIPTLFDSTSEGSSSSPSTSEESDEEDVSPGWPEQRELCDTPKQKFSTTRCMYIDEVVSCHVLSALSFF